MKRRKRKWKRKIIWIFLFLVIIGYVFIIRDIYDIYYGKKEMKKESKIFQEKIDYGVFNKEYHSAQDIVKNMTIEEKIGQLFLVRYSKTKVDEYKDYYPGGYILFARDFENHNKESIKKELSEVQSKHKYPLIIGVDEEGGYVTRVSKYKNFRYDSFETPRYYYDQGGYDYLEEMEKEKIELLKEIGINLNLAPVADLSTNPNDFIYNRSFGYDTEKTSEYIEKMVNVANQNNMNSCLKHFPGYGNNKDTHTGVAIDEREYNIFLENDYKPFMAGIQANVPSILVSHNIVKSIDEKYPSSLSKRVISELRDKLGYTGIIMTDDLAMSAVKEYVDDGNAATLAINAGEDMIITSDFIEMRNELLNAYNEKKISEKVINTAVTRIIAWKIHSGLL